MKASSLLTLTALFASLVSTSHADDFAGADFSLRYSATLSHFSPYADVAAKGGASAASKWGSSENPAAIAWLSADVNQTAASAQYSNVAFDQGTQLNFTSGSISFGTLESGVFRLDAGLVTSNERLVRDLPAAFDFDLGAVRLNYAKKFTAENMSIGASVGFAKSETTFKTPLFDLAKTNKDIWSARLGGLWEPTKHWLVGLTSSYIYGPSDTTLMIPTAAGFARSVVNDVTHQFTVQPGIAYEYSENALIHLDYQLGYFTNDTGHLSINRWMAGTDIKLAKFFYLRAGGAVDQHSNVSWTAGLGFYPSEYVYIDLAYQNNAFPEVEREFGRSRTLNASLTVKW